MRAAVAGALFVAMFAGAVCLPGIADAAVKEVEEYDGYIDDADLRASWVVASTKDTVFVKTPGYQTSTQSMKISYHNGADPWWTGVTMTYATVQDWSDFRKLSLRYMGMYPDDDPSGNSGETFFVRVYDEWGGYIDGPKKPNATKTWEWVYYAMDISAWAGRSNVQAVAVILEPGDYGHGVFHVDRITVDTFPPILDDFETYANTIELISSWLHGSTNVGFRLLTTGPDGIPGNETQYLGADYLCSNAPYQVDMVLEFDFQEDWSQYHTLRLLYRPRPDPFNSQEAFTVVLEDAYGGIFQGPIISEAVQCSSAEYFPYCPWYEYVLDFTSWPNKGFVKKVIMRIVPETYGDGALYIDYIRLEGEGTPAKNTSWGAIKAQYR